MSNLTDLGIVIKNVVANMSAAELTVSNTKYLLDVKCTLEDTLNGYDEVYLVQGGDLFAKDGSNVLIPEADISLRHATPANKFLPAVTAEGVTSEIFKVAVASPLASVSFDWTPLIALVKDGVTTYVYGDTQRVHTAPTILHQAAIESVHVAVAEGTNTVTFVLDPTNADKVVTGEQFEITLSTGTYRGLVTAEKEVVIEDASIANIIRATAQGGPLSFSHLLRVLGNISFDFAVSGTTPTTAGFSIVKPVLAVTSDGTNLVTENKGAMYLGASLTHANEKETGGLRSFEAYLKGDVKTVRVVYDLDAYHMGGGTLNIHWGASVENRLQGKLVLDGAVTYVEFDNAGLYDYILAEAGAGELVNVRMFVTAPAALSEHYATLKTSAGSGLPAIPHGEDSIVMVYDKDSSEGTLEQGTNPDLHTTSTDILDSIKLTKLGTVVGTGDDAQKVVMDAEGANVGDVVTFTSNYSTVDGTKAGITVPKGSLSGIKRRDGFVFSNVNADWAAYFNAAATPGGMGSVTSYVMAISQRVEYNGEYDVTVGNNGTLFGYNSVFGAINKVTTDQALGYVNTTDGADTIPFANITEVTSNGTSVTFGLHDSAVMVTGKTVTLRRSTDESEVYTGTITRTVEGVVSATFGPDLAFTLANEYADNSIFSFDLAFAGEVNIGEVLVKTASKDSSVVTATYGTADNTLVSSVAVADDNSTTNLTLKTNDVAHSVYRTTYLEDGEVATKISNIVGDRTNVVAYPDAGLRTAISKAVYTALHVEALPLGNNAIKVAQTTSEDGTEVTYGFNAEQGAIYYTGLVIDGKFDAEAKILAVEVTTRTTAPARTAEIVSSMMRVNTAGLEAVGKTVTLTTAAGTATGILEEVDGSPFLQVNLVGTEFWNDFMATPINQWIPLSIDFQGTPTLVVPQALLQGGGSSTLPYSKVEGEETGTLTIDENLPQNGLDNLMSFRVDGDTLIVTTTYPSGSVFILDKVDGVSVPGGLLSADGIIDGTGRVELVDAALASLFANSHTNNVVFDVRVTLGNPDAAYQVTMAIDPETGYNGYTAGVAGSINTNILAGEEDKFNVNKYVLITDVLCTEDDVVIKLNETAIQQVGRTIELVSVYKSYQGVVTVEDGVPTVRLGTEAWDEVSLYPEGFLFGFDLVVTGEGTAFIGDSVMRVTVGTGEDAFVATAQEAPISAPGYIVKTQEDSAVLALKQIVARNDGKTVRIVLG